MLGIDISREFLDAWRSWFAPSVQPFPAAGVQALRCSVRNILPEEAIATNPELRDTCFLYGGERLWVTEADFFSLSDRDQKALRAAWVQIETFEDWLQEIYLPDVGTGHDDDPGTALVWTEHGRTAHAAVTIGEGWALSRPSQAWSSPRLVWTVRDTILRWRFTGPQLSQYRLRDGAR